MARKKALFVAEGVTLAHVGRAIRLALFLRSDEIDVELACDSRFGRFLAHLDFPVHTVRSIASETFLDALARGRPVFSQPTLAAYVRDDLALIEAAKPDAVVGDFRLSLSVSARLARIPYANVTNAYWSPYAKPRFRMPSLALSRLFSARTGDALFAIARPFAFAMHAMPMNGLRRANGLPPLGWDVRRIYCDGDLTLYADAPELIPTFDAPPSHRYIGPVLWSPAADLPSWWHEATANKAPIYVSLGSSGQAKSLPMVVDALRALGRPIVVATAGRSTPLPERDRVWVADFVPGELMAAKACAVVCNGGSPTAHQALAHGVPVIGLASNLDQHLNMHYIERFGAGIRLHADRVDETTLREATRRAIEDNGFATCARAAADALARVRPEVEFVSAIRTLASVGPQNGKALAVAGPAANRAAD
jgi:UDP:flavonoid glycosyltransferase YjiC (YdhE family)